MAEAGEIMDVIQKGQIGKEDLLEIGRVIAGDLPGRTSEEEITIFKSVGVAVQDAATAHLILERAIEKNLGKIVQI